MAQMQALLKIKADVDGEGKVNALGRAIGGLSSTAGKVSGGFKGLVGAAGGLSNMLGSLVPLATGAGLAAMAKGAIDAADNMNDLSQKTGVSVESLSKFQQAANASGTSIEGVGAAMIKLNKGLAAGTGPAADALKALGLSATDASGKLKTTDAVMLEVADKFKAMPDGANKTALALQLFGKAGADMIPLLNGGSKAITDLSATMTGEFAKGADNLNDKLAALQGKMLQLGVTIGTALMPVLNVIADLVLKAAEAFAAMPGPIQAIIGGAVALAAAFVLLAPAISAVISIAGVLAGLKIGATIAGWAALAGPAITAITAAFTGFMAFLTGTLLPGLLAFFSGPAGWTVLAVAAVVAMAIAFREPIMQFFTWLGEAIPQAFSGLIELLQPIFVQPFIDLWNNVLRGPVTAMFNWIGGYIQSSMRNAYDLAYAVFVQPWLILWNTLRSPVVELFSWIGSYIKTSMAVAYALAYAVFVLPFIALWENVLRGPVTAFVGWLQNAWNSIFSYFNNNVVAPIRNAWNTLSTLLAQTANTISTNVSKAWGSIVKFFVDNVTKPISTAWTNLITFLPKAANTMGETVKSVFANVGSSIKGVLNGVLRGVFGAVNGAIANINSLIQRANAISKKVNGPQIPELPILNIPQFAKGGYVGKGTLAVVGEAGPEYIIPASKMAAASANYLNGARGGAVIPAFANGGFVGGGNAQISVTTGPVLQQGGQQYVTMADLEKAMRKTADGVYASLRTPSSRIALGAR